jgi:hypothetical protein
LKYPCCLKLSKAEKNLTYNFFIGPSLAIGLGGERYEVATLSNPPSEMSSAAKIIFGETDYSNDTEEFQNALDPCGHVGFGLNAKNKIVFNIRYSHGYVNVVRDSFRSKSRTIIFTVGVPISFNKKE